MKCHLCKCGAVILEERGADDSGRYVAEFRDLEGAVITNCPGCGADLDAQFGPNVAEKARENGLPAWLYEPPNNGIYRR